MELTRALPIMLLASCAPTRESAEQDLRPRASLDLSCPVNQLVMSPSGEMVVYDGKETDTPKSMGVTGCGRIATYTWVKDRGYVMNNTTTTTVTKD